MWNIFLHETPAIFIIQKDSLLYNKVPYREKKAALQHHEIFNVHMFCTYATLNGIYGPYRMVLCQQVKVVYFNLGPFLSLS